jgi:SAM-dependent methyltransferase
MVTDVRVDYDAELTRYGAALRRAWAIEPHHRVLDVGCGAGQTTRDAARLASEGSALGVDLSAVAIERARVEEPHNVTFECADAQTYGFAPGSFDLAISRFGTMFFDDPVAAFGNIGRALRPEGRLVMLVWQAHDRNEWSVALHQVLGEPPVAGRQPDPFSLADPTTVEGTLRAAGFGDIDFGDAHEPVYYGPDVAAALEWVRGFTCMSDISERPDALARLHDLLAAHMSDDGIWFDSRAWLVSAHRRSRD